LGSLPLKWRRRTRLPDSNAPPASPDGARTITFTGKLQADAIAFSRDVETVAGGRIGGPGLFGGIGPRTIIARRIE
jgi:hypothetical protein